MGVSNDHVGKRFLIANLNETYHFASRKSVEEVRILEISPTKQWVKIQNMSGNKFWKATTEITILEELDDQRLARTLRNQETT